MIRVYKRLLSRLRSNERGSIVIISALSIFTLIGVTGAGIDLASQSLVQRKLQQSSDLAAVAAGSTRILLNADTGQQAQAARRYFALNYPRTYNNTPRPVPTINISQQGIEVSAQNISVPTAFGTFIGVNSLQANGRTVIGASSTTTGQARDLVMILDNSGSMGGQRLADLQSAAGGTANSLLADNPFGNRVALVPYDDAVLTSLVQPLSDSLSTVMNAINAMTASGLTNSAAGFSYARSTAGYVPTMDVNSIRSVVWLTDGVNTAGSNPDGDTLAACSSLKSQGILVFTIAFGSTVANDPDIRNLMSSCASSGPSGNNEGEFFFPAATGSALQSVFQTITNTILELRIAE